jgi:ATP-binding cassette subfamily C protein
MRLFLYFARSYPASSAVMLGCLLLGVLAEGAGISTLLPLLSLVTASTSPDAAEPSQLEQVVRSLLDRVGVEPVLGNLLLIFVAAMVVQSALVLVAKRQVGYTVARVTTDLRLSLLRALSAARWSYFTKQPTGTIANSIASETSRATEAFLSGANVLSLAVQAALSSLIALAISWQVTLAAMLAASLTMYAVSHFVALTRKAGNKQTKLMNSLLSRLTDSLQAVKPLKAMAREALMGPLLEKDTRRLNRALERRVLAREALKAVQAPLMVAFLCLGIYVAVTFWEMPLAELGVLALLFNNTLGRLTKAQRQYQVVAANESALWSMQELIDRAERHRESTEGHRIPTLAREIQFERVALQYENQTVLGDASFQIPAGQITAIVGPSGAGKTSLADLVCGLVRPSSGAVRVDGIPLEELDLRVWRQTIGYVSQEMLLLNDSVRANVTLGEDLADADVETALRQAGAWDFVSALPDGIDSLVGEHGARLSGGQRQRISIARALVHDAKLLILDEATTALDPETEIMVWESLGMLRGEKTILAISHQPQLMAVADRIYRIDAGRVHAVDTKDEPLPELAAEAD